MDFILLRSYDSYINAHTTLNRLGEEGITAYLKDEYTVTIDPFLSNALGGIKLMVYPDDYEEAVELLRAFDKVYRNAVSCPECGSHEVDYVSKPGPKNWIAAIVSWFMSSYAIALEQVYQCSDCHHQFDELPERPSEQVFNKN